MARHRVARDISYSAWDADNDETLALIAEHADLEQQIRDLRARQHEASIRAEAIRFAQQAEINVAAKDSLLPLAGRLYEVLNAYGPTWEGHLTDGFVEINCYDMHKTAHKNHTMWCGWSAPWAYAIGAVGDDDYPFSPQDVIDAMAGVGLTVKTWRGSDAGISCTVLWPQRLQ